MINKNKEEIERLNIVIESYKKEKESYFYLQERREERIKTSILWCKDEIEFLKKNDAKICSHCQKPNWLSNSPNFQTRFKQLQTHLNWLKEQEKKS